MLIANLLGSIKNIHRLQFSDSQQISVPKARQLVEWFIPISENYANVVDPETCFERYNF